MALSSPDTGRLIQTIDVNGLSYHHYAKVRATISAGDSIQLCRQPENRHDSRAIAVVYDNRQVGWVPRDVNQDLAAALDRGDKLRAVVLEHNPAAWHLRIGVYDTAAPAEAPRPLQILTLCQKARDDEGSLARLAKYPKNFQFDLETGPARVSVSVVHRGKTYSWIRKSELEPKAQELCMRRHAVAVLLDPKKHEIGIYRLGSPMPETSPIAPEWNPNDGVLPGSEWGLNSPTGRIDVETKPEIQNFPPKTHPDKENTMNFAATTTQFVNTNKGAFAQAGYLEAGRIANNQVVKLSVKFLPFMLKGYADTPVGKLVIANLAQMAAAQLRPQDPTLAKLTGAMTVAAYQEIIQTVDIEGWLDELLATPEIKRAVAKMSDIEDKPKAAEVTPRGGAVSGD